MQVRKKALQAVDFQPAKQWRLEHLDIAAG
jgi:hypothetical protein